MEFPLEGKPLGFRVPGSAMIHNFGIVMPEELGDVLVYLNRRKVFPNTAPTAHAKLRYS